MHVGKLNKIPLLSGLTDKDTETLVASLETRTYPNHQTIFWSGDAGTDFFIIQSGRVHLSIQDETGKETPLASLGPGDYFGELSLLDGGPRTATCRAASDITVLVLSRDKFLKFLESSPKAVIHLLETISRRQRETLEQLRGVRNPNLAIKETVEEGPLWPRIADRIAAISASKQFLIFHIFWFAIWIGYNLLVEEKAFDPYPFGFLTMTVSLEAIFLSIFVLVSANRQSERDRIRADVNHQVNLKAHHELLVLQRKLDQLNMPASENRNNQPL